MSTYNVDMNPSILTVLLAAAEKLYAKDKYAVLQIAALMEQMARADDLKARMDRIEEQLFGDSGNEQDEIDEMKRNLGL